AAELAVRAATAEIGTIEQVFGRAAAAVTCRPALFAFASLVGGHRNAQRLTRAANAEAVFRAVAAAEAGVATITDHTTGASLTGQRLIHRQAGRSCVAALVGDASAAANGA